MVDVEGISFVVGVAAALLYVEGTPLSEEGKRDWH